MHDLFSNGVSLGSVAHKWEYGPSDHLICFIEAGEKWTHYGYDSRGRLERLIKPDGSTLVHAYDELGRLVHYYGSDFDYHYVYDPRGRLLSVSDAVGRTTRAYDVLGHVVRETLAHGLTLTHTYDELGRCVSLTLPDRSMVTYSYDGVYLRSVSRGAHTHVYAERTLEGQSTKMETPLGDLCIKRDPLGRYLSFHAPRISAENYTYDAVDQLLRYTSHDSLGSMEWRYVYDDLGQVIEEDGRAF